MIDVTEGRFRALVQLIKASPNYNPAIGEALGVEGTQQAGPNLATVQPELNAQLNGGQMNVKWGWGGNAAWTSARSRWTAAMARALGC